MINQTHPAYHCPFCHFAQGGETPDNTEGDIVYQDPEVMTFVPIRVQVLSYQPRV